MALSQSDQEYFKGKLLIEKERLEKELSLLGKKVGEGDYETNITDMGSDEEETASEVEEYVDNLSVETNLEGQLQEVLAALERVERGTYGICEKSGEPIDHARLEAYPSARFAIEK
jgi:RNA polymerase-binding transcription factor DksA